VRIEKRFYSHFEFKKFLDPAEFIGRNLGTEMSESDTQKRSPVPEAMRYLGITVVTAAVLATLFTAWSPASLDPGEMASDFLNFVIGPSSSDDNAASEEMTAQPQNLKIGVIAGHSGLYPDSGLPDPGAVCDDDLTELEVNESIAELVAQNLEAIGLEVDRLEEFDSRLDGYRAGALVSIHADACYYINEQATGYKVSPSTASIVSDLARRLATCIIDRYGRATELNFHQGSITTDMTEYHTFLEIDAQTPAVIIETGFLYLDRNFLTQEPEKAARGIAEGILCYMNNEAASIPEVGFP
jgi:N-acetylmuramoyl-L-alanine amidase